MLAKSSLQPSSIPTYRRAIFHSVVTELPISPHTLALFIAYMYDNNYAPSTVSSYVSALGYSHRLLSFPDPTKAFFIIQMLKGYTKLGSHLDSRLPITLPILHRTIEGASQLAISQLHCCQFQAMCAIAFYGFYGLVKLLPTLLRMLMFRYRFINCFGPLPSAIFTPDQCVCVIFMCPVNEPGRCSPVF